MNHLGSGERRDTNQGPNGLYLMTNCLKSKNTGQHRTCFTRAGRALHATIFRVISTKVAPQRSNHLVILNITIKLMGHSMHTGHGLEPSHFLIKKKNPNRNCVLETLLENVNILTFADCDYHVLEM